MFSFTASGLVKLDLCGALGQTPASSCATMRRLVENEARALCSRPDVGILLDTPLLLPEWYPGRPPLDDQPQP